MNIKPSFGASDKEHRLLLLAGGGMPEMPDFKESTIRQPEQSDVFPTIAFPDDVDSNAVKRREEAEKRLKQLQDAVATDGGIDADALPLQTEPGKPSQPAAEASADTPPVETPETAAAREDTESGNRDDPETPGEPNESGTPTRPEGSEEERGGQEQGGERPEESSAEPTTEKERLQQAIDQAMKDLRDPNKTGGEKIAAFIALLEAGFKMLGLAISGAFKNSLSISYGRVEHDEEIKKILDDLDLRQSYVAMDTLRIRGEQKTILKNVSGLSADQEQKLIEKGFEKQRPPLGSGISGDIYVYTPPTEG